MPTITYDRDLSNQIRTNLQKYWRENVYNGVHAGDGTGSEFKEEHFICRHQEACKQSCEGSSSLQAAEATRFGDFYALEVDEKPLRIVIAGISISDTEGGQRAYYNTIANAPIEHPKAQEIGSLNNQVKGTMLALQLLFGKQPYVNQFRPEDHEKLFTVDIENVGTSNLLQCYTLANRLLCSVRGGTSKGATTPPMRLNCKEHTLSILKILDPTILILQGTDVWSSIIDNVIREYLPNTPIHRFYHPAREWFSHEHTHFKAKVAPALVPVGEEYGFAPYA